jgi:hypothetical protein
MAKVFMMVVLKVMIITVERLFDPRGNQERAGNQAEIVASERIEKA